MSRKQWLQLTYTNIWINHKCCHLNREGFHQAIYPHWNPNTYTDGKPTSWIRNPRDTWLFDSKNTQVVLLEQQIKMAFDRIGRKWWKDYTDYFQGTRKFVNTYEFD